MPDTQKIDEKISKIGELISRLETAAKHIEIKLNTLESQLAEKIKQQQQNQEDNNG